MSTNQYPHSIRRQIAAIRLKQLKFYQREISWDLTKNDFVAGSASVNCPCDKTHKQPTMAVHIDNWNYFCDACGAGGNNPIDFIRSKNKVSEKEAQAYVENAYGISKVDPIVKTVLYRI